MIEIHKGAREIHKGAREIRKGAREGSKRDTKGSKNSPTASTNMPNAIVAAPKGRAQRARRGEVGWKATEEDESEQESVSVVHICARLRCLYARMSEREQSV